MQGTIPSARGRRRSVGFLLMVLLSLTPASAKADDTENIDRLMDLDLEALMELEVTSVSKRAQKLSHTPAAVYVIGQEEIRRSGMQTIPDLLRGVPGIHVSSIDANKWEVSSRGFHGQFMNKLLVLIDGRSVYTLDFGGVYWDIQDLVLEDIDRIEVIRGPGGTIWGANAVNGVINIITKSSKDSEGLLLTGAAGTQQRFSGSGRWGGAVGDDLHYRAYVKGFDRRGNESPVAGAGRADDAYHQVRTGFRTDWDATGADLFTLQGDYYNGTSEHMYLSLPTSNEDVEGGNVIARWTHIFTEDSDLVVQAYYDGVWREDVQRRDTTDLEFRHRYAALPRNEIVWGGHYRLWHDTVWPDEQVYFDPRKDTLHLVSGFFQDEISIVEGLLRLTLGSKFEYNGYSHFEYQPSGRILLTPHQRHSVWAAVSRAVHTPARLDQTMHIVLPNPSPPPPTFDIPPNPGVSEKLLATEFGYRGSPIKNVTLDLAAYYNRYKDLQTANFPVAFGNEGKAQSWGVELWTSWQATSFLRLTGGYTYRDVDFDIPPGSVDALGSVSAKHQFNLRSRLDLPWNVEFDSQLFWVTKVPAGSLAPFFGSQPVGDYFRLDMRLGWRPWPGMELSLVGQNLTEAEHWESGSSSVGTLVPRSCYGKVRWEY